MDLLSTVVIGLLTLGLLVVVHEFGHFWVARRCGVHVLRFSIGFGKPLWSRKGKTGTEYVLAPIPLGGYVQMLGEQGEFDARELGIDPQQAEAMSFSTKSISQRAAIVVAGPAINILLALLIYWGMFMSGVDHAAPLVADVKADSPAAAAGLRPGDRIRSVGGKAVDTWEEFFLSSINWVGETAHMPLVVANAADDRQRQLVLRLGDWLQDAESTSVLEHLGIVPRSVQLPVVDLVVPGSPAAVAGLLPGDHILRSGDKRFWGVATLVSFIQARPEQSFGLVVRRGGVEQLLDITPEAALSGERTVGRIGIRFDPGAKDPEVLQRVRYGPVSALGEAADKLWQLTSVSLVSIGKMIAGAVSPKQLAGPITIVKMTGEAAGISPQVYLQLMALISLSLGILNLLPIPVLDGGHLLFLGAEAVRGKPLPERVQAIGLNIGLLLIGLLMLFVIVNDILRL